MQLERPRFRQDLVAEPIEDGNTKFIDVMDPDSNAVYRFYEVEYSLACAMDGERDVAGVVRWAQEELGLATTANEVKSVIATLGSLQFLDSGEAAQARPAATQPAASKLWDTGATTPSAPAATTKEDDYLQAGVVVGQKRAQTPVPDMELGNAGATPPTSAIAEAPAANVELGVGVSTGTRAPALAKADDIALGVPGRVDVSVDLSDQVKLSPNDVKEAVRASKVMNAVELPEDLKNALDQAEEKPAVKQKRPPPTPAKGAPVVDAKTQAAAEAKAATEAAKAAKAEATKAEAEATKATKAAEAATAAAANTAATGKAAKAAAKTLPKPVEAKPAEAKPTAPNAPEQKVSRPLLVGLVVVVLAVIAFLVYKNVIASHAPETDNMPPPPKTEPVKPPPPPAPESEKLATNAPASESIKPVSAGTIEMIAASDAKVKEGDALVRFTGAKALDTEVSAMEKDVDQRVKTELFKAQQERDAAIASGNKAAQTSAETKVAERQKSLDEKQAKIVSKKAELDKLQLKSPANGTFTAKAKTGTKVTPTDEVGMLVREPTRTVTFKKADPTAGPKARVILVTKDNAKLSCVVTSSDASGTTIECPQNSADEGTEVTFGGVDTTPPAGTGSDASVPVGSGVGSAGSASGSSGSGAEGSAAAGSDAAVPSPAAVRPTPAPRPRPASAASPASPKAAPKTAPKSAGSGDAPAAPAEPAAPAAGSDQ